MGDKDRADARQIAAYGAKSRGQRAQAAARVDENFILARPDIDAVALRTGIQRAERQIIHRFLRYLLRLNIGEFETGSAARIFAALWGVPAAIRRVQGGTCPPCTHIFAVWIVL